MPFRWALKQSNLFERIDLQEDIPSECAKKLKEGYVDLALVPAALIPELESHFIETEFCIGANGRVNTVKLYSHVPVAKIEKVILDYQSKTSNALVRILFEKWWKKKVEFVSSGPGFENNIDGNVAAIVIGDRCFELNNKYSFEYDLAYEWKSFTGLPFTFAIWVSTKKINSNFISEFNATLKRGIENLEASVLSVYNHSSINKSETLNYLNNNISFHFNLDMKKGLEIFLRYFSKIEILK